MRIEEIVGGAPYGATTVAGGDGSRQPTEIDMAGARHPNGRKGRQRGFSADQHQPVSVT